MWRSVGLLLTSALSFVGANQGSQPSKEAAKLEGVWTVVSMERDGKASPEKTIKGMMFVFKGNHLVIKKGRREIGAGTIKINTSSSPHSVDYREGKDIISPYDCAIFQIDDSTLKWCTTADRSKRPTAFDSKQGLLFVLKRK
jgi:uncharacterized protein (TIGR03067 family)